MSKTDKQAMHWLRWYDKYPNLRAVINLTEKLPPATQTVIGDQLLKIVKQYWGHHKIKRERNTFAAPFVDKVKKSSMKRRWYDAIPAMRIALNLILMLPPEEIKNLDKECARLVGYIATVKEGGAASPHWQKMAPLQTSLFTFKKPRHTPLRTY